MNIALDIIVLTILIFSIRSSTKKGFFKTLISLACLVCTVIVIYIYAQPIGSFLNEKIVAPFVADYVLKDSEIEATDNAVDADEELLFSGDAIKELFKNEDPIFTQEDKEGNTVKEFLIGLLKDSAFLMTLCAGIAAIGISVVVRLAALIIEKAVGAVLKLPILNEANKGLGAIIGIVNGVLLVWILCIVVNLLATGYTPKTENGSFKTEVIEKTYVYKYAEEYSPINKILE